jgi:hypothetical protein
MNKIIVKNNSILIKHGARISWYLFTQHYPIYTGEKKNNLYSNNYYLFDLFISNIIKRAI